MSTRIADLAAGTRIDGAFYVVLDARPQQKRDGSPYMRGRLRDATGIVDAVAWDCFDDSRAALVAGKVVKVRGLVTKAYNGGGLEITIERIRLARVDEYCPEDFLRASDRASNDLVRELRALIATIRSPFCEVVNAALEPELDRFARWPAAEELHHAWLGGLLQHSLEVASLCDAIIRAIPGPDRDLAVAGALLHDVGKLDAYAVGATLEPTDDGRLIGHVLTGFHRVKLACDAVQAPRDVGLHLLHIVASHHGTPEHGAAREPATREAIVVHFADELSAQLQQAGEAIASRRGSSARWSGRARGLKRDVFIGDYQPEMP